MRFINNTYKFKSQTSAIIIIIPLVIFTEGITTRRRMITRNQYHLELMQNCLNTMYFPVQSLVGVIEIKLEPMIYTTLIIIL